MVFTMSPITPPKEVVRSRSTWASEYLAAELADLRGPPRSAGRADGLQAVLQGDVADLVGQDGRHLVLALRAAQEAASSPGRTRREPPNALMSSVSMIRKW